MAEITTTQAFSDGDTVTANKLNNITANAAIQTEAITNRSAETTVDQANDLLLMYDASATALKKISLSNVVKAGTASNFPVTGNATVGGTLGVTGVSTLTGNTSVGGTLGVTGASTLTGNTSIVGTLGVDNQISANKPAGVGLSVTSDATVGGDLAVTGDVDVDGDATIDGTLGVTGDVAVNTNKFNITASSGNTTIAGTLGVTGAITASSTVNGTTIPTSKTLVTTDDTQTLTNKTLTSPVISSISNTGTLTLPTSTDTLVGRATTDTLTNKTLTSPAISGGTINNASVGATTPSTGAFTTLSASSTITSAAGTAAAPAIVPTGDTDTGLFFPAADTIAFSEGGTEAMRINSSGRVGIGTTNPSDTLHIKSSNGVIVSETTAVRNSNNNFISFKDTTGEAGFIGYGGNSNEFYVWNGINGPIRFGTNGTERFRIDSSGNVGIGRPPNYQLDVYRSGTTNTTIAAANDSVVNVMTVASNTQGNIGTLTSHPLTFITANTERLRIDSSGNVGIGTSSPATRLHVDGTIRYTNRPATGTITAIGFDTNGDLKASSSSLRYKHNVEPYAKGLAEVAQLEPVTFNYNGEELVNAGLIVEDLDAKGFEEFVLRDSEGTADAIPYGNMVALLINAIKELKVRVEALEAA